MSPGATPSRSAMVVGASTSDESVIVVPDTAVAVTGIRFILGEPMKPATNRLAGL